MELENTLAGSIRAADANAAYDAACKRLLSEKIILAWIMKSCLPEYRDAEVDEIAERYIEGQPEVSSAPVLPDAGGTVIRGGNQEDASLNEGTVYYDIRFNALAPGTEEYVRLIINVEAQNDYYPGYPLTRRGIYYCARLLSGQYGREFTKSHYEKLRKVYSIWICMNPPKRRENTVTRYRMTEERLAGKVFEDEKNYDLLSVIMICLGPPAEETNRSILKLLGTLLSNDVAAAEKKHILQTEFQIPMTEKLESEVSVMCNLSKGVEERGIAKGMAQGMVQGRVEGRKEGREQGLLLAVRSLMDGMHLGPEEAMTVLRIPEDERPGLLRKLSRE